MNQKSSLKAPLTLTRICAFLYIDSTISTNHSSTPRLFKTFHTNYLDTLDQKLSSNLQMQSTNSSFLLNISLVTLSNEKRRLAVPYPGMKPNCISSVSTCCLINFSITLSTIYRNWSVNFSSLEFPLSTFKGISFALVTVFKSAKFPFWRNNSYYNLIY